ncbi:hypothetical protein GXW82_02730 [Streptacidiphilus sp. 4-A2]|nr:hypothetical protein [Streptacidiphilus sp. 4-A2]
MIEAPLVLPPQGGVRVQVTVDAAEDGDEGARGEVAIYSQPEQEDPAAAWTRHATGVLTAAGSEPEETSGPWPPTGAVAQELDGFYPALAAAGLGYGPLFQGVRALWRRGDEVFAEIALADDTPVSGFGLHPALLDAALHPICLADSAAADRRSGRDGSGPLLPFAWSEVVVHATGARAARVRLVPAPTGDGVSLTLSDEAGAPIATVGALALRPLPATQPGSALAAEALFTLDWVPLRPAEGGSGAVEAESADPGGWALLGPDELSPFGELVGAARYRGISELAAAVTAGRPAPHTVVVGCPKPSDASAAAGVAELVRAATARALATVQRWLAAESLASARLVLVTERAVEAGSGDTPVELADSGVWGLLRVAAGENPGRLALVDLDVDPGAEGAAELLRAAVTAGEVQIAVRSGQLLVPRLARVASAPVLALPADAESWRLGFSGRGTLGNLVLEGGVGWFGCG